MDKKEIIRIYMQVSDELCGGTEWCWPGVGEPLQRFASLVAAAEREACAKLAVEESAEWHVCSQSHDTANMIAAAIRARGKE